MSRGRPRHQASRRRTYSTRQRELRERRVRSLREERVWTTDTAAAFDIDETDDFGTPGGWNPRAVRRSSAG